MNKQDYIEEIANCIADSWLAADAGDQVARKATKQGAMEIAKQAVGNLGHTAGYWLAESQFRAADLY